MTASRLGGRPATDSSQAVIWIGGKLGVYSLRSEEGFVSELLHKPTGHVAQVDVDAGFCIMEDWELKANWSDLGAKVWPQKSCLAVVQISGSLLGPFGV